MVGSLGSSKLTMFALLCALYKRALKAYHLCKARTQLSSLLKFLGQLLCQSRLFPKKLGRIDPNILGLSEI